MNGHYKKCERKVRHNVKFRFIEMHCECAKNITLEDKVGTSLGNLKKLLKYFMYVSSN